MPDFTVQPRTGPLSVREMKGATWGGCQGQRQHAQSRNRNIVRLTASMCASFWEEVCKGPNRMEIEAEMQTKAAQRHSEIN